MPDPTMLADDLRSYFAATTSTALPPRVASMSTRVLPSRRRALGTWLAVGTGALATAAIVLVVATHVPHGGSGAALSSSAAAPQAGQGQAFQPGVIAYPGIDTVALANRGVRLQLPPGQGGAAVTPVQAQAAARGSVGIAATAAPTGPAVLTSATLTDRTPAVTCLCWVVDVPVNSAVSQGPGPGVTRHTSVLVLVDAVSGRVDAVVTGNDIP